MRLSFLIAAQYEIMMKGSRKRRKVIMQNSRTNWVTPEIPDDLLIDIPEDLLIEILNRLPGKSVMRFKCMSKFWSSLLSSRYFCNRYLTVNPSSTPHQLPRLYMSLIDRLSDYSKFLLLSSSSSPTTSSSSLVFNKTLRKMGGFYLRILRGFICFSVNHKPRIYNPSTRQLVILPAILASDILIEGNFNTSSFICHDPIHDQYKILCTISKTSDDFENIRSEHWVYLLEAGGSWKRVAKEFPHHLPHPRELTMDGVLYYLAWTNSSTCVLVSFDMSSEEFNMIQLPHIPGNVLPSRNWRRKTQINYHGKVAVFDFTYINVTGAVDLWILEDWRKDEWLKKTLVLQPSQMHLLGIAGNRYLPKSTTLKDKVILIPERLIYPFYILCYDLQTNHLKKIHIKGIPDRWFLKLHSQKYFDLEFMDVTESILYLET